MVKGDAMRYAKSIKGKMTKAQSAKYGQLLFRESKGYDKAMAEAKKKLERIRERMKKATPKLTIEDTDSNTYMTYDDAKRLELREVGGKKTKRILTDAGIEHIKPKGKEIARPKYVKEQRSVKGVRKPLVEPVKPKPLPKGFDPTDFKKIRKDLKKDKTPFFKPEFIEQTTYGMGLGDDQLLEIDMPTTTTGGEGWVMDEGRDEYHFPRQRFNEEFARTHNAMLERQRSKSNPLVEPRLDLQLTESSVVGKTINRGDEPISKPVSWEGTTGRGLSRKQKQPPPKVNTLEKTLRKGGYLKDAGGGDVKVNLAGQEIIKGAYSRAQQPRYEYDDEFADLRLQTQASTRGECGDGTKTCSEFYVMVENSAPEDMWNMGKGDWGESKQRILGKGGEISEEQVDRYMNRPDSKARFRAEKGRKKIKKPSELDYKQALDMDRQLLMRDDLKITELKGKDLGKVPITELRRLAQTKGIPTTTRKEEGYAPAKLSKANLIKKLNIGLPRDTDIDTFEYNPDEARRVYESGLTGEETEEQLVNIEDEALIEFGDYEQYTY